MNPERPPPAAKKEVQLQGPRPSPLKVNKESVKIKKPPPHPHPHPASTQHPPPHPQPVVIYSVSPKVIHTTENEFMSLVQRLTGPSTPSPSSSPDGLSPAARLASVHKTSPNSTSGHNKPVTTTTSISTSTDDDFMRSIFNNPEDQGGGGGGDEMGQFPGILSPPPGSLPAVPSGFFSQHHQHDVISSPMLSSWMGMAFSPGPSSALISPSPCSWDLFNDFLHNF